MLCWICQNTIKPDEETKRIAVRIKGESGYYGMAHAKCFEDHNRRIDEQLAESEFPAAP